jgi:DNA-binding PadR family transcriptional regulator
VPGAALTSTSYAILGLLAVRPHTTYELAAQTRRARDFWPRAASTLYLEPKKLVAAGLAKARTERSGRRPRTVYTITAKGRRALGTWLGAPGAGPTLEFEGFLKLFFAEHGDRDSALATLERIVAWCEDSHTRAAIIARGYLEANPFAERMHVISITYPFIWDFTTLVLRWARWAASEVEQWPADMSSGPVLWDVFQRAAAADPSDPPLLNDAARKRAPARRSGRH